MAIQPVRLFHAALDEVANSPAGIVVRGSIDLSTLHNLRTDDYQRSVQPLSSQDNILDALKKGDRLPDLDLGMRGQNFMSAAGSDTFELTDPVFIIDGLQRQSTIIYFAGIRPDVPITIGATVHLNTTKEWERDRFHKLNNWRHKLSPNVLLRNMRDNNEAVLMLYGLSHDKSFIMCDRISWDQRMRRQDLLTALNLLRIAGRLHSHKGPGSSGAMEDLARCMVKITGNVGLTHMRQNLHTFFGLIDECWGVRAVQYKEGAVYMRTTFLAVLAKILSDAHDFWQDRDEKKLFVNADLRRKIASFPVTDPAVSHLCASSGKSRDVLYVMLHDHINSRRKSKLRMRSEALCTFEGGEDAEEVAA